ncbi:MAG: GAF domain-containing protein [Acholeplasmatales bacterium]|nr:MAG: GAF domain-containing protein [Acholeplasmatales bacterium]
MFTIDKQDAPRHQRYALLLETLPAFLETDVPQVTLLANVSALLNVYLDTINWVGFYMLDAGRLTLGPFQGQPACTTIAIGHGVCGTAAQRLETVIVNDVDRFPGHIACDANSRSEIVIPLIKNGVLLGVIDVDSPVLDRFSLDEVVLLEKVAGMLVDFL